MKIRIGVMSWVFMIIAIVLVFLKNYNAAIVFAILDVGASIPETTYKIEQSKD
jgi:hypothetical protein